MKKVKLIVLILTILLVIALLACLFFKFFMGKNPALITNLDIVFNDSEQSYEAGDDNLQYSSSYSFKVVNNNSVNTAYSITISDNSEDENSIERKYIHYQLILNNKIVHAGELSDIKNNVIDTRIIEGGYTNNYTLKVWTDEVNTNNKTYEYKLKISKVVE